VESLRVREQQELLATSTRDALGLAEPSVHGGLARQDPRAHVPPVGGACSTTATRETGGEQMLGLGQHACRGLVRFFQETPLRRVALRNETTERYASYAAYVADRTSQIADYQAVFSPFVALGDKVVAELGCSRGYLLNAFLQSERFTAIGIDSDPSVLRVGAKEYPDIRFVQSTASSIPLPDASVDVIYTIDTVEHLSRPQEIILECYRVLRPGGQFLVHFHPWLGPYGAHLEDIIPFPWPHVVFSMETLLATAADIYDSDGYEPACYWFDSETGKRRPNPYRNLAYWREFLNRMTIRQFRRVLATTSFDVEHFEQLGFGGRRFPLARYLSGIARIRGLDEFFVRAVFCVLRKR
jgi:ubiquinone/menaquinone biosynthesis C-methylase UbiE